MKIEENIAAILQWNKIHAVVITVSFLISWALKSTVVMAVMALGSFLYYLNNNKKTLQQFKPFGGYANWVTSMRLVMLITLMFSWTTLPDYLLNTVLILFVCLDVVDGWFARKFNQSSVFGQYYDMELDALFVLFACLLLYMKGIAGVWILIPGGLRYIFVLYTWLFKGEHKKESRATYGAWIAGTFFVLLLISFVFQNSIQDIALKISGLAIVVSFGISFYQYKLT